ncbi:MAG: alpha/beta hydrolase [Planctomycetes bacterium]|nr:alpha/beta hydrolase [Planctomycetota bacterium]
MAALLGHEIVVAPEGFERTLFLLHGIMGWSRNWRGFARRMVQHLPDWRVVLVDLRGHGTSRDHGVAPHDLPACARDLEDLIAELGSPEVLVGHSFGGKVVVEASRRLDLDGLDVIVLDCPMRENHRVEDSEVGRVFRLLDRIDQPFTRRSEAQRLFEGEGFGRGLAGWMATNLIEVAGGWDWHFRIDVLRELLADYWRRDYLDYLDDPGRDRRFLLVKAARSDRFDQEELDRSAELVAMGRVDWRELPAAGHWLHIDNPDGLLQILEDRLRAS